MMLICRFAFLLDLVPVLSFCWVYFRSMVPKLATAHTGIESYMYWYCHCPVSVQALNHVITVAALCPLRHSWCHFRHQALPVPAWSFVGSHTRTAKLHTVPFPVLSSASSSTGADRILVPEMFCTGTMQPKFIDAKIFCGGTATMHDWTAPKLENGNTTPY